MISGAAVPLTTTDFFSTLVSTEVTPSTLPSTRLIAFSHPPQVIEAVKCVSGCNGAVRLRVEWSQRQDDSHRGATEQARSGG